MSLLRFNLLTLALASISHANNALNVNNNTHNNKSVDIAIMTWGSDWYYTVMSVMGATALGILAISTRKPRSDRVFFYMSAALCFTACIAFLPWAPRVGLQSMWSGSAIATVCVARTGRYFTHDTSIGMLYVHFAIWVAHTNVFKDYNNAAIASRPLPYCRTSLVHHSLDDCPRRSYDHHWPSWCTCQI